MKNDNISIIIPNGVEGIMSYAFKNNRLTTVTIPNSMETIFGEAFHSNPNLTNIINQTGKTFNWNNICFGNSADFFETGTITNGTQTITITSE